MAKKATKEPKPHANKDPDEEEVRYVYGEEAVRKMQDLIEFHNGTPERAFDEFEALATPPDSQAKKHLIFTVWLVRHCIEDGDALYASYYAMRAGVLAHSLGWTEEDAEQGRKVREAREGARNKEKERHPEYRATLKLVQKEEPGLLITAAKEEAARRCGVSYRTIHRYTR